MPSTPKYTARDVAAYFRTGEAPEELSCTLGYHVMRQPVTMNGDPVGRIYDARFAKLALEQKYENPFSRTPITGHPALLLHRERQSDLLAFRDAIEDCTRTAAARLAAGDPTIAQGLVPEHLLRGSTQLTPRETVAGQTICNAYMRRLAARPVPQPRVSRREAQAGHQASHRAGVALSVLDKEVGVDALLQDAQQSAVQARAAANIAVTSCFANSVFTSPGDPAFQLQMWGLEPSIWPHTLGADILERVVGTLNHPTPQALTRLLHFTSSRNFDLSQALVSNDGAMLQFLLKAGAYDGLAAIAPALTEHTGARWSIGPDGEGHIYLGERRENQRGGCGLRIDTQTQSYHGGLWAHGQPSNFGVHSGPLAWTAGHWHEGNFQQGVKVENGAVAMGTFRENGLDGRGIKLYPDGAETHPRWWFDESFDLFNSSHLITKNAHVGQWLDGELVAGKIAGFGVTTALVQGPEATHGIIEDIRLGAPFHTYGGDLVAGVPHGYGEAENTDGVLARGRWYHGQLLGPGACALPDGVTKYGVWAPGFNLDIEEEEHEDPEW